MDQNQSTNWFEIVKWALPGGLFFTSLTYLWAKYFRIRPKVLLSIEGDGNSQSGDGPDRYKFSWYRNLVFHNDSIYVARRISIIARHGTENWKFKGEPPAKLDPDIKDKWSFTIEKSELRDKVISLCGESALTQHRLAEAYFPHILKDATIQIAYDNEKDTTFYSSLRVSSEGSRAQTHWFKPRQ